VTNEIVVICRTGMCNDSGFKFEVWSINVNCGNGMDSL